MMATSDSQFDVVIDGDECPKCKENRVDYLVILDDEATQVECKSCGNKYEI